MINIDLKDIEIIPSSSNSNYDDTQLKSDIVQLQNIKADRDEIPNILAGDNISILRNDNDITISSSADVVGRRYIDCGTF